MTDWVVFDYDGTLTTHRSGWTLLHALFGTERVQAERMDAHREGELGFDRWARLDVESWVSRGATAADIESAAAAVKLAAGAARTLEALNDRGYRWGVLSGGIEALTAPVRRFDPAFVRANRLVFDDGALAGVDTRVGPSRKDRELAALGETHGFEPGAVTFVGDSHSDLEAFDAAGHAVLFDPDPALADADRARADTVVESADLSAVLDEV